MKLKKYFCIFILTTFMIQLSTLCLKSRSPSDAISSETDKKMLWCWTKSMANEPSFILNNEQGGINWGYCQKDQIPSMVKYIANVSTSQIDKSESNSVIKIQIFGEKGNTKELILSSSGFERGSEKTMEFQGLDVGSVSKINLKVQGNQGYRCKNIEIRVGNMSKNFECLKRIEPCKPGGDPKECSLDMMADGETPYEVTIKTSEDKDAGISSPVLIMLKGSKGDSRLKVFNELGAPSGSSQVATLNTIDVGDITGFKLILGGPGNWKPILMTVKNLVTGIQKNFDLPNANLVSPGNESFSIDQSEKQDSIQNSENGSTASSDQAEPEADESSGSGEDGKDSKNLHNPNGGLIESVEKKNIIDLTCDHLLMNPSSDKILFGPDYPTRNINYIRILARCPSNCHKVPGTVFGLGIHPDKSPICLSALVDKAISYYGGIISISIFPGLDSYNLPSKIPSFKGITIKSITSKSIMKSFVLSRVDNIDLVDKDLRIVNHKGELAPEGRLDIRIEGQWGSVCSFGNSPESANVICKNIGYKGGEWKNPSDQTSRDFCRTYNGFDYCGAEMSRIHFSKIECTKSDIHINKCNKSLADMKECTHGYDAIIKCYNENFETDPPIPVGVIRLTGINKENDQSFGRLEMYNEQKFSSICDLGFNNESANIACRQMGYVKGKHITDPKKADSFKLDNSSNEKFAASNIECRGNEKSLKECRSKLKDIHCKHQQDVVISCEGPKGDPTGLSQYKPKDITPLPELGKLGMSRNKINCNTKGNDPIFRGDPGSIFLVQCPALCSNEPGIVSGTGLYTGDSNVCLAAIHSGVIEDNKGGLLSIIKTFGQIKFDPSKRFGINSSGLNIPWVSSFSISSVNSGWLNMNKIYEEGVRPIIHNEKGMINTSFLTLSDSEESLSSSIPKPVFEFIQPNPKFLFSEKENFFYETHNLSRLSSYSILTRFRMTKFVNKKEFIFSYSGCNGFNILINKEDTLIIGDMCNPMGRVDAKIMIPLNELITLFITYEKANLKITLHSEKLGIITKNINNDLEINPADAIGLGRLSRAKKDFFFGEINFFMIYDAVLDSQLVPVIINHIKAKDQALVKKKTEDGRDCLSPCIDSKPGEGVPTKGAELDDDDVDASSTPVKNEQGKIIPPSGTSPNPTQPSASQSGSQPQNRIPIGTYDKNEKNNQETIPIDCSTNLTDKRFDGSSGKFFRVHCPVCTTENANVYGTGVYHPRSSICKASMHIGLIKPGQQSDLLVEITGPKNFFLGSQGIDKSSSTSIGKSEKSFVVKQAQAHKKISCETTAAQDVFQAGNTGKKFVVDCPKDCSKSKNSLIFGSEIYSDNSSICLAAIHYGILTDKGGEIEFMIEGEQSSFKSTKGFGITSKSKDSYIRSFRFFGQKSSVSYNFMEDYLGKLPEKWKIDLDNNAVDKLKDSWEYKIEERKNPKGIMEKFKSIIHTGTVRLNNENSYASFITLKDADFANGIIKFNLKFVDLNRIAVLFRYTDKENYYGIGFDLKNKNANIKIFSKVNSSYTAIESKVLTMLRPEAWFRCTLIINYEDIQFLIQQEDIREHKLIFAKKMTELHRGTLGFATNGNSHFYLSGIKIREYKKNQEKKTLNDLNKLRTFEDILKNTTFKEIKKFCKGIFQKGTQDFERCKEPHTFCLYRCDTMVPTKQESIINYKCYKSCVKTVYDVNAAVLRDVIPEEKKYSPKAGDKVDFLKNDAVYYRPGVILKVDQKKIKIEYHSFINSDIKTSEVIYDGKNVVKCGEKLPNRLDCNIPNAK
jgi:hypothetical protein